MSRLKIEAYLIRMIIGFCAVAAVTALASLPFSYTQAPASYGRRDILGTEAFSPLTGPTRRHVIIGSCEISLPIVANNMDKPGITPRNEVSAWLGNILNFLMRNIYNGGDDDGFYDMSAPNTGLAHHAQFLWYATRVPGLSSIVFVNGLSLGAEAAPDDALEVVAALERMEADLPAAAPAIRAFGDTLRRSEAYRTGERRHPDWRNSLDSRTATIEAAWASTINARETRISGDAPISTQFQFALIRTKAAINAVLGGSARLLHLPLVVFGADSRRRDEGVRRELDWAKTMTARDTYAAQVEPLDSKTYLNGPEREAQRLWLEMLAAVAKARGVKLVIYGQPMLGVSPAAHTAEFRPHYIEQIRDWLAPWAPAFIDHTIDHDLGIRDFALSCPADNPDCIHGPFVATGYNANIIGRYRQGLLLIEALRGEGVLNGLRPRPGVNPHAGIPPAKPGRCITYVGRKEGCIPW